MDPFVAATGRVAEGHLTRPSGDHHASFLTAMREFHAAGHYHNWPLPATQQSFASFLADLELAITCPLPGYVPEQTFWLVVEGQVCGVLHFRNPLNAALRQFGGHVGYTIRPSKRKQGLGSRILQLGLPLIWQVAPSLERILLTCYENNPASQRIIERNGGRWENTLHLAGHPSAIRHYWIEQPVA